MPPSPPGKYTAQPTYGDIKPEDGPDITITSISVPWTFASPPLEQIKAVCTIIPKVHTFRDGEGETFFYGEVWITYGVYENIVVHHDPILYAKEATVEKNLEKWIKSKEGRSAIYREILDIAGE